MTVSDIVAQVIHRVGKKLVAEHGEGFIVNAMQREYERLNMEYCPIEESWSIAAGTFDETTTPVTNYTDVPERLLRPFWIDPHYEYLPHNIWRDDATGYYTIRNRQLIVAGATTQTALTIKYYSSGKTLTVSDPQQGQVSTPEYPAQLQQILIYATALELSMDYPMAKRDMVKLKQLESRLAQLRLNKQASSPHVLRDGRRFRNSAGARPSDLDDSGRYDPYDF